MKKETVTVKKTVDHPLEEVFDIEPNSTLIEREEIVSELIPFDGFDEKDSEIESQIQEVYDKAMGAFERIQDECEELEGKYLPRMMEVGVQHLNAALAAAQAKAKLKEAKEKIKAKNNNNGPKTINNNLIISREELLKLMDEKGSE